MLFDSYAAPDAERLLELRAQRYAAEATLTADDAQTRRAFRTELVSAATFILVAALLVALAGIHRTVSPVAIVCCAATYLVALRVTFPVATAWTAPTQLSYVVMLFVLPAPIVPALVGGCLVLNGLVRTGTGAPDRMRLLAGVGDASYTLGPAILLSLVATPIARWSSWPVWIGVIAAQLVVDFAAGSARTWFAERLAPQAQPQMAWLYFTDLCLSCAALPLAMVSAHRPGLALLSLPLMALLSLLAAERRERLDGSLKLSSAYRGTAMLLGDVVEADDRYTGAHSQEVLQLSLEVAGMLELDSRARRNIEFAALLHDVGKIRIPNEIINKPSQLDDAEWALMQRHTLEGEAMLARVGGALTEVGRIVRSCHERYDGRGYPDGLAGEDIPLEARIICVCDSYNAMTTDRSYRRSIGSQAALAELHRCSGTQFDPDVVDVLAQLVHARAASGPPTTSPLGASRTQPAVG